MAWLTSDIGYGEPVPLLVGLGGMALGRRVSILIRFDTTLEGC